MTTRVLLVGCLLLLDGCASIGQAIAAAAAPASLGSGYRIVTPASVSETTPSKMIERLARADLVVFGEQHDDPETHRAEAELLDAIGRTGRPIVVSLEMFERDVQPVVDEYLAGRATEGDFLARSRPWERYATDYRRLIQMAKDRRWRVVAANVPRPLASAIGRKGFAALDTLTVTERRNAAREYVCSTDDDYHARFMESMQTHSLAPLPGPRIADSLPTAIAEQFYLAQCIKDETMAESIVDARLSSPQNAIVVHFNGAFHSDYAQGTVARIKRRQPAWTVAVVSAIPVPDPTVAPIVTHSAQADFIIFTRGPVRR